MLSAILELNSCERQILEFAILINSFDVLEDGLSFINNINANNVITLLSRILNINAKSIKNALFYKSNLMSSFIFTIESNLTHSNRLPSIFDFADYKMPVKMVFQKCTMDEIFENSFKICEKSSLGLDDFGYLGIDFELLQNHLKSGKKGINILLYGRPGTGKTEFAKVVTSSLNKNIYEIAYQIYDGCDILNLDGKKRILSLKMSDIVLKKDNDLIMFDEIEDLFESHDNNVSKAFINRTLESNDVPTFWITNNVMIMDNAYIRRFDMVFEFKIPPKSKRFEIVKKYAEHKISDKTAKKLAKNKFIAPSLISNAAKVISCADRQNSDKLFKNLIENNLMAQGVSVNTRNEKLKLMKSY
ncbi:MAG: AAA family ATPase, partial [Campylobacter sp.]|nr:AAA family ATPase [Campylobacter sp.]